MVRTGAFRQDLYYRVGVFRIELSALHTRREDIPLVADALLESVGTVTGNTYGLSPAALAKLMKYPFPGIRELRNTLHLGASLCCAATIRPEHIQLPEIFNAGSAQSEADMENSELDDAEHEFRCAGSQTPRTALEETRGQPEQSRRCRRHQRAHVIPQAQPVEGPPGMNRRPTWNSSQRAGSELTVM